MVPSRSENIIIRFFFTLCFIFKTYNKISSNIRKKVIDVRKIDQKKQIEIFGLPKNKLNAALKRKFTIPIKFIGNTHEKKKLILK